MRLRALALLGGLLLLALPAAAFAQSAGDEQYSDPLASPPPSQSPSQAPSSQGQSQSQSQTQHAGTPSSSNQVADNSEGSTASAGDTSSSGDGGLPRTGLRVWMLALMGGLMLLGGLLVRLGLRPLPQRTGGVSPPTLGRDIRLMQRAPRR